MTVNTIKFSQFAQMNLGGTTNTLAGVSSASGGDNVIVGFPLKWTTAGRPATPGLGLLGYNVDLNAYEFWNGSAWTQFAAGGSGTVNAGLANQIAYYATSGTAISGLPAVANSVLSTNGSGMPALSSTLPASLVIPTPRITGVTDASNASAGDVGEFMSSVVLFASAVPLVNNTAKTITTISLTAGDWDVWGNAGALYTGTVISFTCWVSSTQFTGSSIPDFTLRNDITLPGGSIAGSAFSMNAPSLRFNVNAPTTIYLQCLSGFNTGTANASGAVYARRRR